MCQGTKKVKNLTHVYKISINGFSLEEFDQETNINSPHLEQDPKQMKIIESRRTSNLEGMR